MNKTKKLLSVLLAVIMILSSMSIMSSAAITQYKTVQNLKDLDAYSPYGQVTRLSTEERASIVQDFLDAILPGLNINLGTVGVSGLIEVTIDLTSVDQLCVSLDSIKEVKSGFLYTIAAGIVDLGILETLTMDSWNTDIDRAGDSQLTLFAELFELLSNNTSLVNEILTSGLDLGILGGLIGGLDLSSINEFVTNLPALVKGLVYPMIERWDDTLSVIKDYDNSIAGTGKNVEEVANWRIKKLFTDNMSITTIKYDAEGNMTSEHNTWLANATGSAAPTASDSSLRYYYQITGTTPGSKMYSYHIVDNAEAEALAKDADPNNDKTAYNYVKENQVYVMTKEVEDSDTCETYVWKAYQLAEDGETIETGSDDKPVYLGTLKYYNDASPLIPALTEDVVNSKIDLRNTNISAGDLLYTFIPYLFEDLAVVVLNGSVKKILAEFFGAQFTMIGTAGLEADDEIAALGTDDIFVGKQGDYVFEWSDYYVADDGTHYYRYLDDLYVADLSNTNNYFDIINWEYEFTGDFMEPFIPEDDSNVDSRLLLNLNDFLVAVAEKVTVASATTTNKADGTTESWTRPTFQKGSNAYAVNNIKAAAQAVISLAPKHIFGSNYETNPRCYYDMFMYENADEATENAVILTGIAAQLVDIIMPSMTLPTAEELIADNTRVGAILAGVVREFAAYLAPEYNFDALIYADFGTTEADTVKTFLPGKDSEYWFDVILTMGINIGFEYLRAFADMGEGTAQWNSFVSNVGYGVDGKTYAAGTTREALNAEWEGMLDYIIDWALATDQEWTWKMANLVDTNGLTIDLATAQDPFVKIQQILGSILPVDEILTVEPTNGETKFEHWLRQDLILGIVDLKWDHLVSTIEFSGTHFRTGNVLDQLANLLKGIINPIFKKIGGGSYEFIPSSITDFDTLASQSGIKDLAVGLVGKLYTAYGAGLLDTLLPFLNFLLGWKTDPQVYAEPVISTTFRDGNDYAFQWDGNGVYPSIDADNTQIHFLNNSSGMLEIHRNSDDVDHEYAIQIKSVTSDASVNTLTFDYGDGYASPYETIDIKIGGKYNGEEAATITIAYEYLGKDGKGIGDTQYTSLTIFFSNQYEDNNVTHDASKSGDVTRNAYNKFIFTNDIYNTITNYTVSASYSNSLGQDADVQDYQAPAISGTNNNGTDCDTSDDIITYYDFPSIDQHAKNGYFNYRTRDESGWGKMDVTIAVATSTSSAGGFFKENATYGPNYDYPTGIYAYPKVLVAYDGVQCVYEFVFIHYDDHGIYDVYTANKGNGYNANQGVDSAIYNEYNAAWKDIVKLATYPLMTTLNGNSATDYLAVIEPQIEPAMERFEAAKEAYETALAEAQASGSAAATLPSYITDLRDEIDNDYLIGDKNDGKEINFQDVEFYEYFNYNDVKVAAENLYRTYLAPEVLDTYHIFRSGIREAELNFVIAGEDNATIQEAIKASRRVHDQAAIDASVQALAEWKQPITTKLYAEDLLARLAFYKQFVKIEANREDNDHLYFLEQELAHLDALNLDEADYESVSWDRYAKALAEAEKVAAGTDKFASLNSRIYDVKYNLMVAYKQLLLKDDSLIEAGGTAELLANIDAAEAILAMNLEDIVLSDIAIEKGLTKEQALGHLIEGLGYYYQARYSKHDVEVQNGEKNEGDLKYNADGSEMIFNLYDESAYEYADNDRPNNDGNQAKVNACNANLEACLAYFVTEEEEIPTLNWTETGFDYADTVVNDTANNNYGEFTGIIYGIDTLDQNEMMEQLGTLADALKASTGDDAHIIIEPNEMGNESTDAMIYIVDSNGDVLETYVFVYFGDIDGDAMISANDAYIAEYYEASYEGIASYAQYVAADLDGDGMPSANDAYIMEYYEVSYEGVDYQYNLGQMAMNNTYEWIY